MAYSPKSNGRNVDFQRRHFEFIAAAVKETPMPMASRVALVATMVAKLKLTNPHFRAETFAEACGVES